MSIPLPFGLTASEYAVIKKAYERGCFAPGSSAGLKSRIPQHKELAAEMGLTPQAFSAHISSARRKILQSIGKELFENWVVGADITINQGEAALAST